MNHSIFFKLFLPYLYALIFTLIIGSLFYCWQKPQIKRYKKYQHSLQQKLQKKINSKIIQATFLTDQSPQIMQQQLLQLLQNLRSKLSLQLDLSKIPHFSLATSGDNQIITHLLNKLLPHLTSNTKLTLTREASYLRLTINGEFTHKTPTFPINLPLLPGLQTTAPVAHLLQWGIADLHYHGYLQASQHTIALLSDPQGNYHQVKLHDRIDYHGRDQLTHITSKAITTKFGQTILRGL